MHAEGVKMSGTNNQKTLSHRGAAGQWFSLSHKCPVAVPRLSRCGVNLLKYNNKFCGTERDNVFGRPTAGQWDRVSRYLVAGTVPPLGFGWDESAGPA